MNLVDIPIWLITVLMFALLFIGMAWGLELGFLLGGIAVIFTIWLWGPNALGSIITVVFRWINLYSLTCIPLYIFMALVLERSGIAEAMYESMYKWVGRIPGGLAMGTVGICTILAAMTGGSTLGVATMGIVALPSMFKRGYDKKLVLGSIMAGAGLGSLIPPSIIMILYALFSGMSIGQMFIAGIIPGLILSSLFIMYIGIRCILNPSLGPPLPPEERVSFIDKLKSLKAVILPIMVVVSILGSIFAGLATPTEAGAVGALGALISAAINRKLSWKVIWNSCIRTFGMNVMVKWIIFGAAAFAMVYKALGATDLIADIVTGLEVNRWVILLIMQFSFFLLGCVLNNMSILMITLPIYLPVIIGLDFHPLWFGILYVVNMEMGLMTPPFGFTLFYMRAVTPPEITLGDLYRSIWPFVALQATCLGIIMAFPVLALWLPGLMIRPSG